MFIREQFIDREEITRIISKRINDFKDGFRQNIAILGDKLIGKTWLIKYILENLNEKKITPLYFDLSQPHIPTFILRFLVSLPTTFLKAKEISVSNNDINTLVENLKFFAPKTAQKIQAIYSSIKENKVDIAIFREVLGLLELLNEETGQLFIIILEDFQNLELLKIRNIFPELGKKIMLQKNTMYVVASSNKMQAKKIIHEELSLLFGNFEILEIPPLSPKASEQLVKNRCRNIIISQDIINYLYNFTGGHPFYLERIARQIYQNTIVLETPELSTYILLRSLEEILFNDWGVLNLHFQNYVDRILLKNRSDILNILLLICQGKNRIKELSLHLHKKYSEINQKLSKLIEANIISRSGSFYSISNRVFNFWLKFVYLEKIQCINQDYNTQVINFRKKIEQSLFEFIENSKKDLCQRLLEIFSLFDNESIEFGKKKINLTQLLKSVYATL